MAIDLDTFLVAVYTLVDDWYQRAVLPLCPPHRGRQPAVADSEILTLLLCGQWLGRSERALGRHAHTYWRAYFPRLLSQSAFNRRARRLGRLCARFMLDLARELDAGHSAYHIVDTVPVPLAQLCRGKHHRQFADEAAIGRGGSDRHFYYGCQLLLDTTPDGVISGLVLGPANTEGRWLLDALLGWRKTPDGPLWTVADIPTSRKRRGGRYVGPTGPRWWAESVGPPAAVPYLADAGFFGRAWQTHWRHDYAATVLTSRDHARDVPLLRREHQAQRHTIETVNALLDRVLHLAFPGGHTMWGVVTRVVATCAAFNCGIWLNRHFGRADLELGTLFPG